MIAGSRALTLNKTDVWPIAKNVLLAAASGAITYGLQAVNAIDQSGPNGALAFTVITAVLHFASQWVSDNSK